MGWEKRGDRHYYYQKRRTSDGRVTSTYMGAGALGHLTSEMACALKANARYRTTGLDAFARDVEAADAAVRASIEAVKERLAAALCEDGYHYHRGEWRRKRVPQSGAETTKTAWAERYDG